MRKTYTLLLFLIASMPIMAQQIFIEKGTSRETIEFGNLKKITFNSTNVNILKTDGSTISASMGDIERIHFSNYSSIEDTEIAKEELFYYMSDDCIAVNCNAGEIITVYSIIGKQLVCVRQKSDNGIISIAHLPKGIYIIRINDQTAKFVKR